MTTELAIASWAASADPRAPGHTDYCDATKVLNRLEVVGLHRVRRHWFGKR